MATNKLKANRLNEFISEVKIGVARTNQFIVEIFPPKALMALNDISANLHMILMFCDQAQLPGISLSTAPVRSFGESKEVPYEKLYEPIQLSFYVDDSMIVKKLFDEWMNLIQDTDTRTFNYPKTYIANTLNIIVIDKKEQYRYAVTLHNVYPKAIAPIQLDYAAREVMKLNVTFAYQYATMRRLAVTGPGEQTQSILETLMSNFSYGFEAVTEVPVDYFNDFSGFQNKITDFTSGAKSLLTFENIGEQTGYGGIFL